MRSGPVIRLKRRRWAKPALVAFVTVWLNMALQPCVMAYVADPADCPHCPPSHEHHDGHGMTHDSGRCSYVDGYDYDGRDPKTRLLDTLAKIPPGVSEPGNGVVTPVDRRAPVPRCVGPPRYGGVSTHVFICTFLD